MAVTNNAINSMSLAQTLSEKKPRVNRGLDLRQLIHYNPSGPQSLAKKSSILVKKSNWWSYRLIERLQVAFGVFQWNALIDATVNNQQRNIHVIDLIDWRNTIAPEVTLLY